MNYKLTRMVHFFKLEARRLRNDCNTLSKIEYDLVCSYKL